MYNLGTGKGTSVLEMVAAFEKASGKVSFFLSNISVLPILVVHFTEHKCFIAQVHMPNLCY